MKELVVSEKDLSLIEKSALNGMQLQQLLKVTPAKYLKSRPAKGGGQWAYVSGGYVKKVLNIMFGWDWDFEIIDDRVEFGEAIVKGKLTVRTNGRTIVKTQFGNKEIMYKKNSDPKEPLSIGNDLKAAATDALKKCAAELGIAADVYNAQEFTPVKVSNNEVNLEALQAKFIEVGNKLSITDKTIIKEIISNSDESLYKKAMATLNAVQ